MTGCLLSCCCYTGKKKKTFPTVVLLPLPFILSVNWVAFSTVTIVFLRFQSFTPGTYKSEENQLLLKVYQVKGPTQHYISKFKNDNWAMDGYVSCLFLNWSFSDVLKEYIWIVLRGCGFIFWVLDSYNYRQRQTKTGKNKLLCFVYGAVGLFFSQHKPSIALSFNAVKQTSVSPSSAVHIQRLACFIQVTAESEQKTFVYQGHIHNKDFGKFHLTRQGGSVSAFARNGKKI